MLTLLGIDQLDCGANEILVGGYQVKAVHLSFEKGSVQRFIKDQGIV